MERAFRDSWKDFNHRVASILLIHIRIHNDIDSISEKTSAEEFIDHEDVDELQIRAMISTSLSI